MKKRRNLPAVWVDPGEVWPLVGIAKMARQREILRIIPPAMLACDNMLNVKSQPCAKPFLHPALLAAVPRPLAHKLTSRGIHSSRSVDLKIVLRLRLKYAKKMVRPYQRIILSPLIRSQRPLIALLRQFIHTRLHAWIRRQFENGDCTLPIQAPLNRGKRFSKNFNDRRHGEKVRERAQCVNLEYQSSFALRFRIHHRALSTVRMRVVSSKIIIATSATTTR